MLRGNSVTSVRGLSAAKRITDKAVFLVDNVDVKYNASRSILVILLHNQSLLTG